MRFLVALLIAFLFVSKADLELSFISRLVCIRALYIRLEFTTKNIVIPTLSCPSHESLIHSHSTTAGRAS
ncbi:hypothetical protein POPTR_006G163201v4 [Populus trichocarpa]|uniref:Uncharacterized protein n=1 Tax=Populus trichocarpa TaxID=3694 RepID=A0ACC0SUL9_POPTR|nr:hypothetical protein POPTR_006G163201v4 [Populus trichocarpa]